MRKIKFGEPVTKEQESVLKGYSIFGRKYVEGDRLGYVLIHEQHGDDLHMRLVTLTHTEEEFFLREYEALEGFDGREFMTFRKIV